MVSESHSITPHQTRDHVKGVLLGLAAGDRNGGPVRMALQVAESLIMLERFEAAAILQHYLRWWKAGGFDTGPVAEQVFRLIVDGVAPSAAVAQVHAANGGRTAGCNPAHRSAPLGMAAFLPDHQLSKCAYAEAALTHSDPLAGDVAAAAVMLCRALIRGISWSHAIEIAAKERAPATVAALRTTGDPPQYVDGFAAHALHAAIYFVQESRNFTAALDSALAFAGPANYCPVLVGSVGGARWGAVQIESNVLAHCDILPQIYQTADSLARLWPEDPGTGKYSIDPKQNAIDPRGN